MPTIECEGKSYEVDEEGYLMDWTEWNEGLASHMAGLDEVGLDEEHWEVINFLREYFGKYQISLMIKMLTKEIAKKYGKEKGNTKYIYELFPVGPNPAKQACRYAGIPKPT
jgi:tRNA 2-thiouridine synthesizing protein E